ncbi:MAG: DNA-3-methyladenine glycosylase 2 family protein [Ferruginibacter sp.]|nr:DNA-3-methyladenine glycosylase 2 family protein [Cytophagales bacterium]
MPNSTHIDLRFTGDFSLAASVSLAASASFVEDLRGGQDGEAGVLDLAFPLEGSWSTVGVRVDQHNSRVRASVRANPDGATTDDIRAQLERILSLDVDGAGFADVAARDDVVAGLRLRHPGLRPVLFPSPYEAAARAIIGHQLPVRQAAAITARIAEEHGVRVDVGDHVMHAFPAPDRLAGLSSVRGLAARKIEQLRALGGAADGWLGSARLRAMDREEALSHLQQLSGIGPFSAELVLLRGAGDPDAFPRHEKRLHRAMATAYHLGDEPDLDALERVADRWRPYRSWIGLLLRNSISQ